MRNKNKFITFCFFATIFFVSNVGAMEGEEVLPIKVLRVPEITWMEYFSFWVRFVKDPNGAGGPPSGKCLARRITEYVERVHLQGDEVFRILEVGAGNGIFTVEIARKLERLGIDYEFDAVEMNEDNCRELNEKFKNNQNIHIHKCRFQEFYPDCKYSVIISGLPHHSIGYVDGAECLRVILNKYWELLESDGVLSFFEYAGCPTLRKLLFTHISNLREKFLKKYLRTCRMLDYFKEQFIAEETSVMWNFFPARVWHLRRFTQFEDKKLNLESL